jgi:hypothetical protein
MNWFSGFLSMVLLIVSMITVADYGKAGLEFIIGDFVVCSLLGIVLEVMGV